MPLYEYRCVHCDHLFEQIMPLRADNPCCPNCGFSTDCWNYAEASR